MKSRFTIAAIVLLTLLWCGTSLAMDPGDNFIPNWSQRFNECPENRCGSPPSGGDGGGGGGPLIVFYTWGPTFSVQEDKDADGWNDQDDNCMFDENDQSENADGDRYGDACDNCPSVPNDDQANNDWDEEGDVCDDDDDNDGVPDTVDNCPLIWNEDQDDLDLDQIGDACDSDIDDDTIPNLTDVCPRNSAIGTQSVFSYIYGDDAQSDPCDDENVDRDEHSDLGDDRCLLLHAQSNSDSDGDLVADACDNCPCIPNRDQADGNRNGIGDACEQTRGCVSQR